MDEERTTAELIEALGEDFQRCHRELIKAIDAGSVNERGDVIADYPFAARQLVRAFFAYVEGVIFSVKVGAVAHCLGNDIEMSPQESFLAAEIDHVLDEKGRVVEQRAQIKLARNVRFAFALAEKARGLAPSRFDPSVEWWSCFQQSIKVRDRLTHPKMPDDLDISGDEIIAVLNAKKGFDDLLLSYGGVRKRGRTNPSRRRRTKTRRA